jgi:hypothetical protein
MTDLLDDKIRSLMVQIVEASPTAGDLEEIMEQRLSAEPDRPITPLQPRREQTRSQWPVAIVSAAAVLVLVGGVALLRDVIGADSTVTTTPLDPSSSLTWSRVLHPEGVLGAEPKQVMSGVTVGGPGLVAVGHSGPLDDEASKEDGGDRATVWTSVDGIDWSRVPNDEAVFGGALMNSVTAGGPGLVAVGSAAREEIKSVAAVWTSVDGVTWSRVRHDEAVFGESVFGEVVMSSVTVGGPGLVAVGHDGAAQGLNSNAVVWTSRDGIAWSRVPHDQAIFGGVWVGMNSVTAQGPGLVAVGLEGYVDGEDERAAVWTSRDGIAWSRVPHNEAVFGGGWMRSVTAGGPGLVAVGSATWEENKSIAAVWTSVDGVTWSRVHHDEAVFGGGEGPARGCCTGWMSSVIVGGPGLVAVGSLPDGEWGSVGVVWTSVDGIDWSRTPHNEAVFEALPRPEMLMASVTTGGPGLVAVGANTVHEYWASHGDNVIVRRAGESDAVVWVAVQGQ